MMHFTNVCRLCLSECSSEQIAHVFSSEYLFHYNEDPKSLIEIIEDFTTLKVSRKDGLPQQICLKCFDTLNMMIQFRKISLDSENKLKNEMLIKEEESNEILSVFITSDTDMLNEQKFKIEIFTEREPKTKTLEIDFEHSQKSINDDILEKEKNEKYTKDTRKRCCEICGKFYDSGKKLEYHMNTHTGVKPYKCLDSLCEKMFSSVYKMRLHFKQCHTDSYRFECDICAARFKHKSSFRDHMSYHSDPKIPCDVCGKLMRNRRAIQKHMLIHTGERAFPCSQCGKSFQTRHTLKVHERVHTKEKPFICSKCGESFGYKCLLKTHTQSYHPEVSWS